MSLSKDSKIYVAGHRGLVGSAIWNNLKARGYNNLVGKSDAFSEISMNFGSWTCINGVLKVKGKDNTGRKGDYTLTLN